MMQNPQLLYVANVENLLLHGQKEYTTVNVLATQQPLGARSPSTTDESPTLATYNV